MRTRDEVSPPDTRPAAPTWTQQITAPAATARASSPCTTGGREGQEGGGRFWKTQRPPLAMRAIRLGPDEDRRPTFPPPPETALSRSLLMDGSRPAGDLSPPSLAAAPASHWATRHPCLRVSAVRGLSGSRLGERDTARATERRPSDQCLLEPPFLRLQAAGAQPPLLRQASSISRLGWICSPKPA